MDDLVVWLRAQLDEDERGAQDALKRTTTTRRRIGGEWVEDTVQPPEWRRSVWGPERVLREIDAKRRTVDLCAPPLVEVTGPEDTERCFTPGEGQPWGVDVLRLLALPYADRPGYRDDWRP
ncbi:DUF6221 family protein [Streptomyces sp. NPDC127168]|uniref:DUF6221 family protein n=1 Tax=unclassified Streptomyces TaxID=2593676 RepID=UPI00364432BC